MRVRLESGECGDRRPIFEMRSVRGDDGGDVSNDGDLNDAIRRRIGRPKMQTGSQAGEQQTERLRTSSSRRVRIFGVG